MPALKDDLPVALLRGIIGSISKLQKDAYLQIARCRNSALLTLAELFERTRVGSKENTHALRTLSDRRNRTIKCRQATPVPSGLLARKTPSPCAVFQLNLTEVVRLLSLREPARPTRPIPANLDSSARGGVFILGSEIWGAGAR